MTTSGLPEPSASLSADERSGEHTGNAIGARLRLLAQLLPPGATVSFDRSALEALAASESNDPPANDQAADLTVSEAAERLRLSPNRVRALIAEGSLQAYRIAGRGGWRITPGALDAFRRPILETSEPHTPRAHRVDVSRWRRSVGGA